MRRSVDLPQPEGPTSTRNSPSGTVSETLRTAKAPRPNVLPTPCSSTPDMGATPAPPEDVDGDVGGEQDERADHEPGELGLEHVDQRVGIGEEARLGAEHFHAEAREDEAPRERAEQRADRERQEAHARDAGGQRDEVA